MVATGAADMKRIHRQATMKKKTPAKEEEEDEGAGGAEAIKKPMHLASYDGPAYDKLDQNLETPAGIPRGTRSFTSPPLFVQWGERSTLCA